MKYFYLGESNHANRVDKYLRKWGGKLDGWFDCGNKEHLDTKGWLALGKNRLELLFRGVRLERDMKEVSNKNNVLIVQLERKVTHSLKGYKDNKVFVLPDYFMDYNIKWDKTNLQELDFSKPLLEYFEYHVCDHCNLNCKGCSHIANITPKHFSDIDSYIEDCKRLRFLFAGCRWVKLLGGEPLLNTKLDEFIKVTRKIFPESHIEVCSNGLLLQNYNEKLFEEMRKSGAYFKFSLYPPTEKVKERIIDICKQNSVRYCFEPRGTFYTKIHLKKRFNRSTSFAECITKGGKCNTLKDGEMCPCFIIWYKKLNESFNAGFEFTSDDIKNIYEVEDGWKLDEFLNNPIPFCEYCGNRRIYGWDRASFGEATLEDYIAR